MSDPAFEGVWALEPGLDFLNHGSYGACPRPLLRAQDSFRARLEWDPVQFFSSDFAPLWQKARDAAAALVGAPAENVALVRNATVGINAALATVPLSPGDEILLNSHEYPACIQAARFWAERSGASVRIPSLPWPVEDPQQITQSLVDEMGSRTRVVVISWITSPTALVLPIRDIVDACRKRGVVSIVDAAHAPGQVAMDLAALGPDFCAGNFHKWCCTPKGCAFFYASPRWREQTRPLVISYGASAPVPEGLSRFDLEFAWTGTDDPTPWLVLPQAIEWFGATHPEGLPGRMQANRDLAREARAILLEALGTRAPAPESMLAAMASVPIPDGPGPPSPRTQSRLQQALRADGIQVPVSTWPAPPRRLLRISAQAYNHRDQYVRLAESLCRRLRAEADGS